MCRVISGVKKLIAAITIKITVAAMALYTVRIKKCFSLSFIVAHLSTRYARNLFKILIKVAFKHSVIQLAFFVGTFSVTLLKLLVGGKNVFTDIGKI